MATRKTSASSSDLSKLTDEELGALWKTVEEARAAARAQGAEIQAEIDKRATSGGGAVVGNVGAVPAPEPN